MPLVFNSEMMFRDMVDEALVPAAQRAVNILVDDFESHEAKFSREGKDFTTFLPEYHEAMKHISGACVFSAKAIMSSYGRGTGVIDDNEDLAGYIEDQMLWNPLRNKGSKEIVGRPMGNKYIDIVTGEQVESSGKYMGKKVPGSAGADWDANYAIQNAIKRMYNSLDRIIAESVSNFFDTTDLSKYFDDSNV